VRAQERVSAALTPPVPDRYERASRGGGGSINGHESVPTAHEPQEQSLKRAFPAFMINLELHERGIHAATTDRSRIRSGISGRASLPAAQEHQEAGCRVRAPRPRTARRPGTPATPGSRPRFSGHKEADAKNLTGAGVLAGLA
jgi:hypothetical protein